MKAEFRTWLPLLLTSVLSLALAVACKKTPSNNGSAARKPGASSAPASEASPDAVRLLIEDSAMGLCLFQSRTLRTQPLSARQLDSALRYVRDNSNHMSYHLLFALKEQAPKLYATVPPETRAAVLCGALAHVKAFNDWGLLSPNESSDGQPGTMLIATGKTALSGLKSLLHDTSPARHFGSDAATASTWYKYRRCDYAYRYASLILGRQPEFHEDPKERDKRILQLIEQLKNK